MDDDHLKVMEKEGVEAPGAESSIRRSSRLQSKKNLSSCSKYVFKSYNSNSKYTKKSSKATECSSKEEKRHQYLHRNAINGAFSANTASIKSYTVVPSFEYHVRAKDGIHLVVDLNLKRSDWLKSREKAVCVCQNHSKGAFESFRKEIEYLSDKNRLKVSSPDSMNSCVQNKISSNSMSREIQETLPSVVEKEVITVSGPKRCWSKVDQNSEVVLGSSEISEEVQLSDLSSPQKGSLCSRTGKICSENLLNSANEVNQEADGNYMRSTVKTEEGIESAEGMDVSGREENTFDTPASEDEPKRKQRYYKSDHIHGQSHERILRSTLGGRILEHDGVIIWRSSRLHSK